MTKNPETAKRRGNTSPSPYLPESTVGDQAVRKARVLPRPVPPFAREEITMNKKALQEQIAAKAYELYEKRGQMHGRDFEDWLEAERLVLAELKSQSGRQISQPKRRTRRSNKG